MAEADAAVSAPPIARLGSASNIAVIILNRNNGPDLKECVESVLACSRGGSNVVVADNGSTDGSAQMVQSLFPSVRIAANGANLGFAAGNNSVVRAISDLEFGWLLFLNADLLVAADCLSELLRVAESDPTVGVVGPMVYHASEPNTIQSAGGVISRAGVPVHRGANEAERGQFAGPEDVDWVSGCALMIRRQAFAAVQGFDERFFMYGEEVDLCVRARRADYRVVHVPSAKVWHKGVSRMYDPAPYVTYYSTRNQFLFLSKNFCGAHKARAVAAAWAREARTLAAHSLKPGYRELRRHRDARAMALMDALLGRWGQKNPAPGWFFKR